MTLVIRNSTSHNGRIKCSAQGQCRRGKVLAALFALITIVCLGSLTAQASTTFVVINTNDSGAGSLRQAILNANASSGADLINFNIPGAGVHTISLISGLPTITDPVTINGYSQPGASANTLANGDNAVLLIELAGGNPFNFSSSDGLVITAGSSTITGLVINGFAGSNTYNAAGIQISGSGGNVIIGNFIGTNTAGTVKIPNVQGVVVVGSPNNTIGGSTPASRNVISGNKFIGVLIQNHGATGNQVAGNFIGTDRNGTAALGNGVYGMSIAAVGLLSATGGTIGGTNPGARNVISGNGTSGIEVSNDISGLLIQGNLIGTDVTGKVALGNNAGIFINTGGFASSVIVGGAGAAGRNIISGNKLFGISINSGDGNTISGNYIGTDITGNAALGNATGVSIGSSSNTVGGLGAGDRNVISGNTGAGLAFGNNVTLNFVLGNLIGYGADGTTPVGNAGHGVWVYNGSNNIIGGLGKASNSIAFNTGAGVRIENAGVGNQVSANSITANGGLGIDLEVSGVNANDQGDGDTGANNLLNYPLLTSAIINGGTTVVTGTLNSAANSQFHIEFFANNSADPTGFGEGQSFIGSTDVTTDANGNASISLNSSLLSLGQFVSATTTDQALSTSEFSQSRQVTMPGTPGSLQFSSSAYNVNENGGQATITVTRAGGSTGAASVQYATTDGSAKSASDYSSAGGTLVWASGDTASKTFVVPISNDSLYEANESINLSLTNATGATLGVTTAATLTIIDDDPKPTISLAGVSSTEGNSGQSTFAFTVTLSAASGQAVSVNYGTADGTASSGSDYQPATGQLLFLAGQTSRQIAVAVNGDTQIEPDETFTLNLSSPINATISNGQAVGKIINDDNVAAPSLQFSAGNYSVQEDLGVVTITVTRTGDTSGTASVDYKTNDAMASQKGDFEYAAGRLTLAPGDASKTFQVLINEDMYPEGAETFGLALSNATGATLGQQSTATVTINDDAPESLTNPIDEAQSFVYQHYHDFLNREPDSAGLQFWANEISSCGQDQSCIDAKRANVSAAFYLSTEFQNTGYLVYRTYKAAYGNLPGTPVPVRFAEFVPDTNAISRGVVVNQPVWDQVLESNKQAFMAEFVQRSRFTLAYPTSMTPMQFVDAISANAGITPSSGDRTAAINEFSGSPSSIDLAARARALRDVAENPVLTQQEFGHAFVLMQYFGYLRRDPDAAPEPGQNYDGYNFWLNKLNQFNGNYQDAEMVKAFINSGEYRQRFGQ